MVTNSSLILYILLLLLLEDEVERINDIPVAHPFVLPSTFVKGREKEELLREFMSYSSS